MGYPSDKTLQGLIRNQIETVSKYLKEKHKDSFKVFNLCQESDYNFEHFDNMVELLPMEDHNPPKFNQIEPFCKNVDNWLNEKINNVAIVHCKAGKGRTGTMISCYFIYSNKFPDPFEAMEEFSKRRCRDAKGVTIPSQRRYIEYFADYVQNKRVYELTELRLTSVDLNLPPDFDDFPNTLRLCIFNETDKKLYEIKRVKIKYENCFRFDLMHPFKLVDDLKICFLNKKKVCLLKVMFNTFCLMQENKYCENENSYLGNKVYKNVSKELEWSLRKRQIDLAYKNKTLPEDLEIKFHFQYEVKDVVLRDPNPDSSKIIPLSYYENVTESDLTLNCENEKSFYESETNVSQAYARSKSEPRMVEKRENANLVVGQVSKAKSNSNLDNDESFDQNQIKTLEKKNKLYKSLKKIFH